jgi:hypothetical protein
MIDAINAILIEALQSRLARMGDLHSGLYNFYKNRLERGDLFPMQERKLVDVLAERLNSSWTVHDIGAGIGTLALAFSARGYNSYAIERDRRRVAAMQEMKEALSIRFPAVAAHFHILKAAFPSAVTAQTVVSGRTVGVVTNLVATLSRQEQDDFLDSLVQYPAAVIDVQRFGISRLADSEWTEVVRLIESKSRRPWELISDSGANGKYFMSRSS